MASVLVVGDKPRHGIGLDRVLVVGDGAVARALSAGLVAAGASVVRWWRGQGGEPPAASVAVLAVTDSAIAAVGKRVQAEVFLSCAGGLRYDQALAGLGLGRGLLHPLRAVADGAVLQGGVFGVAGDAVGLPVAKRLVAALGGTPILLTAEAQARYHAAAVLVSNHVVGLVAVGTQILTDLGLDPSLAESALLGLLRSAVDNMDALHLPQALTGPMARGDQATIERHLASLSPDAVALYRATARALLPVALAKGQADPAALAALAALLDEESGETHDPD